MAMPRHPEVAVQLTGHDGNAFAIIASVRKEMRRAGISETEISEFVAEATSGDYNHLLATCMEWVDIA